MHNNKLFSVLLAYLRVSTIFMSVFCFAALFFVGFDPWHSLDGMIFHDLGIKGEPSPETKGVFTFVFSLFNLLSVVCALMMYFLLTKGVAKGQLWACNVLLVGMLVWVLGAIGIAMSTKVYVYLVSAAMMAFLFLVPFALLRAQMNKTNS